MPSEIVSVCKAEKAKGHILIVNGFHRVSAPQWIETPAFAGFLNDLDEGVPDKYDIAFTGKQHDYNPSDQFITNDYPGHGASGAENETEIFAGNSFDYPYVHGKSILAAQYSFSSCSDGAIIDQQLHPMNFKMIDLIYGEQKSTPWQKSAGAPDTNLRFKTFPSELIEFLKQYLDNGSSLLISGAYIASDVFQKAPADSSIIKFVQNYLHYGLQSPHASVNGVIQGTKKMFPLAFRSEINTKFNREQYRVEAPDALRALNGAVPIFQYQENSFCAGVAFQGKYKIIALGFPFESIVTRKDRDLMMNNFINFLAGKK
jgi:hypothetical protein